MTKEELKIKVKDLIVYYYEDIEDPMPDFIILDTLKEIRKEFLDLVFTKFDVDNEEDFGETHTKPNTRLF